VKRYWKGITNPVTLRFPNLVEKKVFWEKTSDYDVTFCNGWKELANYLSLNESQFLVFQYQEKSLFNVIVFGKCGLEIKYPSRETSEESEESDCSLKIIENPSSSRGKRLKSPAPSMKVCKKMKINSNEQKGSKHEKRIVARFHVFEHVNNGWFCSIIMLCFFLSIFCLIL
jgi:hypothetical protein